MDSSCSQFLEVLRRRRSIRRYQPKPVPIALIRQLLEACRWAPSGGNRQPWHVIVVRDPRKLGLIKVFSPGMRGDQPPLVIAMAAEHPNRIVIMDIAMATENIQLAATALGLGACAIVSFNGAGIGEILATPPELELLLLIMIGYPAEDPNPPTKRPIEQFTSLDSYGNALVL